MAQKLTDTKIAKAGKKDKAYMMADGGGLCLHVTNTGSKLWRFRYRFKGAPKLMALGAYPDLSLQDARKLHEAVRGQLKAGADPMEIRKAEKDHFIQSTKPVTAMTTVKVVEDDKGKKIIKVTPVVNSFHHVFLQWYAKWKEGKNARHAQQVFDRVERDFLPMLGHRPIAEIKVPEVAAVALAIEERGAVDLAHRSLSTMGQIFAYGASKGLNEWNPAREIYGRDLLKGTNPQNFARVEPREIPKLLWDIHHYKGMPVTCIMLKIMVRVWLRTSELILSPWEEFAFRNGKLMDTVWKIDKGRMKKVKGEETPHLVPLSRQVIALLEELHGYTGSTKWLFPGQNDPTICMSKNTILAALDSMGYKGKMTGHGFRGLASTCLHEQQYNPDHIEVQLAHLERSSVSGAYNWAEYLEPRKVMMQAWSDHLDELLASYEE